MKKYFVLFKCEENGINHNNWKKLSEEAQREKIVNGEKELKKWLEANKDNILVNLTDFEDKLLYVDKNGIREMKRKMGAYMLIKANSLEEAANLFENHPHFSIFPGDAVEVIEYK